MKSAHKRSLQVSSLLVLASLFAAPLVVQAYVTKAPWRGDSLPHGAYMHTKGHAGYNCPDGSGEGCSLDFNAYRYTGSGSAWTKLKPNASGSSPPALTDYMSFGMPLYAPVDGAVIACWQNMPEDNPDGSAPTACLNQPGGDCSISGNHLLIRTDDNHAIYLAHLQTGSIAPGLCPIVDVALSQGGGGKVCNKANQVGVMTDTRLDLRPGFTTYPRIKKGDFIARAGNSGGTTTPHLHMSAFSHSLDAQSNHCLVGEAYEFAETYFQEKPASGGVSILNWFRLLGSALNIDGSEYFLWSDPIGPRVDQLALINGSKPALAVTPSGGVSVARSSSGELMAFGFRFLSGDFDLGLPDEDVVVTDLDIAPINGTSRHAVAAVIPTGNTALKLIPYFVETDADLVVTSPHTEATPGNKLVRATTSPVHDGIVVATKNSGDGVSVINYKTDLSGTDLSVTRMVDADSSAEVTDLDVATLVAGRGLTEFTGAYKGVVTVEQRTNDSNRMWLQGWKLNSIGTTMTKTGAVEALSLGGNHFSVSDVDVTVVGDSTREFIVASAVTGNNLRVQTWAIATTGTLTLVDQYDGGGSVIGLSSTRTGLRDVAVGVRLSGNSHTLLSFHVDTLGKLRRVGTWDAENVTGLAIAGRVDAQDLITAIPIVSTGEINLTRVVTNYSSGL